MMEKHAVVIRREWPSKEIHAQVIRTEDGPKEVSVRMNLGDFLEALVIEAGSPILLLTGNQLRKRLQEACDTVVTKMKSETRRVM